MRAQTRRDELRYYLCNGARQLTLACDVIRSFHVSAIDETVWQWVKGLLQEPQSVMAGLETDRQEEEQQHSHLVERMVLIRKRIAEDDVKLSRLPDLFLKGQLTGTFCCNGKLYVRNSWQI